jgi:hypothetical protein
LHGNDNHSRSEVGFIFLLSFSAREKHDTKHTPGHRKLLLVQQTVHGTDKTTQSNQGVHVPDGSSFCVSVFPTHELMAPLLAWIHVSVVRRLGAVYIIFSGNGG